MQNVQTKGTLPPQQKVGSNNHKDSPESPSLLWSTKTVCAALGGVHPRTLARMEKAGLIRPVRLLRHKLYSRVDIENFVEGLRSWKP